MPHITITDINRFNRDELKEGIVELSSEISRLSDLLKTAVERLDDLEDASFEPEEDNLEVNDKVKILNNPKGLKGKEARVTKVTDYYVWLMLDDVRNLRERPFKKKKTNVEKI